MKELNKVFDTIIAPADELWERGHAEMREVEIDPGHIEDVPFFDLEIKSDEVDSSEPLVTRSGRAIGRETVRRIVTSDGIDRRVRTITVDDKYRADSDFVVTDGTAWTTTINGYAKDRAERIAAMAGVDVIQIGAEYSASALPYGLDVFRLGRTICNARSISLAKTAQSEQLIVAHLTEGMGLSRNQYAIGDSRGSMKTPGQYPYAAMYGNEIVHMDTKAPCVPEKIELRDVPRFVQWLGTEAVAGTVVIGSMAVKRKVATLSGTTSINPNFIASSLVGIMPALASGEAGRMTRWVPTDAHGHIVVYDKDILSLGEEWDKQWEHHPNIHLKHVPRKTHAHLLERRAHDLQVGRIKRFSEQYETTRHALDDIDWSAIYHTKAS